MSRIRRLFIRFEVLVVSLVLLATFVMLASLVIKHNRRWDLTQEKIYSFSNQTVEILKQMRGAPIEILAFYPSRDENKTDLEVFLKEAAIIQGQLNYHFYDPQKQPALARDLKVRDIYTMLLRYQGREERTVLPDEENFATALLRLKNPKEINVCMITGHGEAQIGDVSEKGISRLTETLSDRNLQVQEVLLAAQGIPPSCRVVVIAGPQKSWGKDELELVRKYYVQGGGVFFMIDPTDKDSVPSFSDFFRSLGVRLASNVIVDKMSRAVGGDFLVPFVNQYHPEHSLTAGFREPTFFPVARTVEPLDETGVVIPVAFSGSNSWAESNLRQLEQGEAVFELEFDTPGPLPIAAALSPVQGSPESAAQGRMVVMGDSDFLTNAYIDLSANRMLALRAIDWLADDERVVRLEEDEQSFVPFTLTQPQRFGLFMALVVMMPLIFLTAGIVGIIWRRTRA